MLLPARPWSRPGSHVCTALGIALAGDVDTLAPLGCIPFRRWPWLASPKSRRELRRFDAKTGRAPVRKHALAVNVQHLPGWDSEVHSPQPEGQPGPRHRDQHGVEAPPLRLDHRTQRGDGADIVATRNAPVIGVVGRDLVAVGHHRARLNVCQHQTSADLNRSFRYMSRSETPA